MKRILAAAIIAGFAFTSCQSGDEHKEEVSDEVTIVDSVYGQSFAKDNAIPVSQMLNDISGQDSIDEVVVEGELTEVCQKMGCWVKLKNEQGDDIFVKFRDHEFFAPKDAAGSHVYIKGKAMREVTPVDELQHYAEDAGESEEVIAAITEPKEEIKIDATGIIIEHEHKEHKEHKM